MISKSTQGLVRSQTVESCQVIPSACQSDGVEEGPPRHRGGFFM